MLKQTVISAVLFLISPAAFTSGLDDFVKEYRGEYVSCELNNRPKLCPAIYEPVCSVVGVSHRWVSSTPFLVNFPIQ